MGSIHDPNRKRIFGYLMSYRQTKIITVALNISMEDPLLLEGPIF
jgi:hypothetical protein